MKRITWAVVSDDLRPHKDPMIGELLAGKTLFVPGAKSADWQAAHLACNVEKGRKHHLGAVA